MKICNKAIVNSLRCHERHTGLFIHKYATAIGRWPTIPSAHLLLDPLPPAAAPLHPALLSTSLLYSSQLYSVSHKSLCPLPYTSYASPADATQVPILAYGCKIEKERAIARCLFSMPEDPYGGSCNPAHGQSSTGQLAWARYTGRWPTILSAHLLLYLLPMAATTLHPTPLPVDPALPFASFL